jgi:hypothetical protein
MQTSKHTEKFIRYSLGMLLAFVALNAFGGGYYGMTGAKNIPLEWLEGSPFQNYFVPGLFLFFVIGGSSLVVAIAVFRQWHLARKSSFVCAAVILIWLAVQINIIGYVSWMQPTTAVVAILILFLTWLLPNYRYQ